MSTVPTYPARTTIIFCDDVRREEGNKTSLMGLYGGVMGISVPAQPLAKLVVAFIFDLPPSAMGAALKLSVHNGTERLVELTASPMPPSPEQQPTDPALAQRLHMVVPIELMGFVAMDGMSLTAQANAADLLDCTSDPLRVVNTAARLPAETH